VVSAVVDEVVSRFCPQATARVEAVPPKSLRPGRCPRVVHHFLAAAHPQAMKQHGP
jgi:hypothetical protein